MNRFFATHRRSRCSGLAVLALALAAAPLAVAQDMEPPAAPAAPRAPSSPASPGSPGSAVVYRLVVADGGSLTGPLGAAVYGILPTGVLTTIAAGAPLTTPTGVLYDDTSNGAQRFFVSDMRVYQTPTFDGALYLVTEGGPTDLIYTGAPLRSPFGMVRDGMHLYVADFGDPTFGVFDGALFDVNLDPNNDGQYGPFPLLPSAVRTIWSGAPLVGPNELIWKIEGQKVLLGDDSGGLFVVDVRIGFIPTPQPFGPPPPFFVDPAGVAALATGFAVTDFSSQEVWSLDANGMNPVLIHTGTFGDQFLGTVSDGSDTVYFVNARNFSTALTDGEVVKLAPGLVSIPYTGAPLMNPFDVTLAPVP